MTYRTILSVGKDHKLVIDLPKNFEENKPVLVTVEEDNEEKTKQQDWLADAASDPLFLSDIEEISRDFESSDKENSMISEM